MLPPLPCAAVSALRSRLCPFVLLVSALHSRLCLALTSLLLSSPSLLSHSHLFPRAQVSACTLPYLLLCSHLPRGPTSASRSHLCSGAPFLCPRTPVSALTLPSPPSCSHLCPPASVSALVLLSLPSRSHLCSRLCHRDPLSALTLRYQPLRSRLCPCIHVLPRAFCCHVLAGGPPVLQKRPWPVLGPPSCAPHL